MYTLNMTDTKLHIKFLLIVINFPIP